MPIDVDTAGQQLTLRICAFLNTLEQPKMRAIE